MTDFAPRATYRIQFTKDFTLADGTAIVPYLAGLGISHLYSSPLLAARAGSRHCYDIVDHGRLNEELGGMAALERLVARLRAHGMGLLLDIVPNHMGVGGADNALWLDVLEWGRASRYATWFDIDWEPADGRLRGRVLLPFLGEPYGNVLRKGEIALRLDEAEGSLSAWYFGNRFPIAPRDYASILPQEPQDDALRNLGQHLREALGPAQRSTGRQRRAFRTCQAEIAALMRAGGSAADALRAAVAAYGPDAPGGPDRLHELLERQSYRIAWWRAASDEVNYRRFFDINELAGFRVEVPGAFDAAHARILELWRDGLIDGVRIDHVDGLADPRAYCRKLRRRMETIAGQRPEGLSRHPWIVVEKILARHEHIPGDWQVDGSTGYDFMDAVGAVLHDAAGEPELVTLFEELSGHKGGFHEEEVAARRQILRDHLAAELAGVALVVHRIMQRNTATRDYTLTGIRRTLAEVVAHFPVYRTYAGLAGPTGDDPRILNWAFAAAGNSLRSVDRPLLDELQAILSGERIRSVPPGPARREALLAVRRFQQLTGPAAAKSVEDTAFYRYVPLISRNEVGSDPGRFALPAAGFARMQRARRAMPRSLLATATHDHKRGEDARMRLAVLTEAPRDWSAAIHRWWRLNAPMRSELGDLAVPSPADEYQLYQMLAGAWPLALDPADQDALDAYLDRVEGWFVKAMREAKLATDWSVPNQPYEEAARRFLRAIFDPIRATSLAQEIGDFVARIAAAGARKSLAQLALKCFSVGVPDFYQGTELWDFSLVDPDNRRPVDFAARAAALERQAPDPAAWRDGTVKQHLARALLEARRRAPELFLHGRPRPCRLRGRFADSLFVQALARERCGAVLVVPRLTLALGSPETLDLAAAVREETVIQLPEEFDGQRAWLPYADREVVLEQRMRLGALCPEGMPVGAALIAG